MLALAASDQFPDIDRVEWWVGYRSICGQPVLKHRPRTRSTVSVVRRTHKHWSISNKSRAMIGNPLAAKKRIDEALEALRVGLTPYVLQRMESAFGKNWRSYASRKAGYHSELPLDTHTLLKTVLDNWREVFSAEAKLRKARAFISLALDARNNVSHFVGTIEQREALRYLDAILEVLRAIGAKLPEDIVLKLYTEQQSGVSPLAHISVHPLVAGPATDGEVARSQTQAHRIRHFAFDHYVAPARRDGLGEITIRAGDVHKKMGLTSAMPAVCNAIGNRRFADLANVTLVERKGPTNGANVYFRFNLDAQRVSEHLTMVDPGRVPKKSSDARNTFNLNGALVLISCVKSKLAHAAPARTLYKKSRWFRPCRDIVEASGARWFLLSALYGLVEPDAVIEPYDYTLNTLGVGERRAWARKVLDKLLPEVAGYRRVVMFAAHRYREFLIEPLQQRGVSVEIPMEHLTRGQQLAWLTKHR